MDTQEQLSAHNGHNAKKSHGNTLTIFDLMDKDKAIAAIEDDPYIITQIKSEAFSSEDFAEICMKGVMGNGHIVSYLSESYQPKDCLTPDIVYAAYLQSKILPNCIYPNTRPYLTLEIATEMLNRDISNIDNIYDTDMLINALYQNNKIFTPEALVRITGRRLLQQTKQILAERGWDKNHPPIESYIYLNNKIVVNYSGEVFLPEESIADIWNTLSDKDIAQLKRDFHIEHAPFDVQLNSTERWRLKEMVINRYEDHHSMLQRLYKYESLYPGLPAVADTLVPLINACNNPASQQVACDLLAVHLRYSGLMKNCPDYNLLANEALQNGWLGDELCNKQTLYNKTINCTEKLAEQKRVEVFDSLRNQQEKTQRQNRPGESEIGRRR